MLAWSDPAGRRDPGAGLWLSAPQRSQGLAPASNYPASGAQAETKEKASCCIPMLCLWSSDDCYWRVSTEEIRTIRAIRHSGTGAAPHGCV